MSKTPYRYIPLVSPLYRAVMRILRKAKYSGDAVSCPCCGGSFSSWIQPKSDGRCPDCQAATRQKMLVYFLGEHAGERTGRLRTLYFAPDAGVLRWFRAHPQFDVTTTDLSAPGVDEHWDITRIPQPDGIYDVVSCCHVLEHVPNDLGAMSELRRVLKPDGMLFLQVPYARNSPKTDEDPTVTDPEERRRRFGQFDHVRRYGQDLLDRLVSSGFSVTTVTAEEAFSPERMREIGLWNDIIFLCRPA